MDAARDTIENLGLNNSKLIRLRKAAIDAAMEDIETFSEQDIKQLIDGYDRPDNSGQHTPFCAVIIYTLRKMV
jgi:hypothetical protein